ncbi:MAG: hypothetical protein DRH12_14670 [Deltaproteobacteria bacterium]|nr:MAG: hypothetical protein DRH12_14670 [Deltaproteobacteria bacterium]
MACFCAGCQEIIGKVSKKISSDLKDKYPNIPWKMTAGTRDRLIHGYFGANLILCAK